MQVRIEEQSPVKKRVVVTIPADRVRGSFRTAYQGLSQRLTLPGFRRGKVPLGYMQRRFGQQVASDVTQDLVDAGWREAISEHDLHPVTSPEFDLEAIEPNEAYTFSFTVEVTPDIDVAPFDTLKIEKTAWQIPDDRIDHELEHLADSMATWEPVADRDDARHGDMVILAFHGRIDGESFKGGQAEDFELVLGDNHFIPGFEKQVTAKTTGEKFDVQVKFPEDYQAVELAGADAVFECEIKDLKIKVVPEIGEALADQVGADDLDSLRADVAKNLTGHWERQSNEAAKGELRQAIAAAYSFELPPAMLETVVKDRVREAAFDLMRSGVAEEEAQAQAREKEDEHVEVAANDIRVELVLDVIAEAESITLEERALNQFIDQMARSMGQHGASIRKMYREENSRAGLRRRLRHDKVLDFLLTKVSVTTITQVVPAHVHGEPGEADDHAHED